MKNLLLVGSISSACIVIGVLVVASFLSSTCSTEVRVITPAATEAVEMNKMLFEDGDPVAEIYGVPASEPQRIICADEARIVRPDEDPDLVLYRVTKERGENPLQEKTVWYFTRWAVIGFGLSGFISLVGYAFLRGRQ